MPKYTMEDMVRTKKKVSTPTATAPKISRTEKVVSLPTADYGAINRKGGRPRATLWFVALASALFCAFALSFLFLSARVEVIPKTTEVTLDHNFTASKEPSGSNLFFDLVVISGEEKTELKAEGEKEVSERATGTAVIFNTYSSATQRLDIDTRLTGSNGKLYKTKTPIVVPGMKADGTAGSVEVSIYAAEPGEAYNSGPLDFQILGFKGTPKYEKFKVRSKSGTDIRGGFIGKVAAVSEGAKGAALVGLEQSLKEKLLQKAEGQIPDGFVLFKGATYLKTDAAGAVATLNADQSATLTLKGTLYGLLFSEKKITAKIAQAAIPQYDGSDVYIANIKDLNFVLPPGSETGLESATSISFNLKGQAKFVSKVDEKKFAESLRNKHKSDFVKISSETKSIESASLRLMPPWTSKLPGELRKIHVNVVYPK